MSIVTGDLSWTYTCEPEMKPQSNVWIYQMEEIYTVTTFWALKTVLYRCKMRRKLIWASKVMQKNQILQWRFHFVSGNSVMTAMTCETSSLDSDNK